jgi:hypothetical protein
VAAAEGAGPPAAPVARLLFLCTGNSARSQIAEALAVARLPRARGGSGDAGRLPARELRRAARLGALMSGQEETPSPVSLTTIVREWGRIGCIGFGGPPTHIKLLRELCVATPRQHGPVAALPASRDRRRGHPRPLAGAAGLRADRTHHCAHRQAPRSHRAAWPSDGPAACGRCTWRRGAAVGAWVAFKVGALSYGGGFVIIPLM